MSYLVGRTDTQRCAFCALRHRHPHAIVLHGAVSHYVHNLESESQQKASVETVAKLVMQVCMADLVDSGSASILLDAHSIALSGMFAVF